MFIEILQGRYEHWHGLSARLTLDDLLKALEPAILHSAQEKNRISTRYIVVRIERFVSPLNFEAWITAGSTHIAIVELEDPVCLDIDLTLDAMGKPEIILKDQRLSVTYLVSEFVFPHRGIVLSVGQPLDSPLQMRRRLLHVRLFPSMSLQQYITQVGEPNPALPSTHG